MFKTGFYSLSQFAVVLVFAGCVSVSVSAPWCDAQGVAARSAEYERLQQRLARGWNTWDTHSVMTQVLLPEGLAVQVGIKDQGTLSSDAFLSAALIGRQGKSDERVVPGPHAYDGSYTDLKLAWRGREVRIQSAHDGDDLVMLVTPLAFGKGFASAGGGCVLDRHALESARDCEKAGGAG